MINLLIKKILILSLGVMVIFTSFFVFNQNNQTSYSFIETTDSINPLAPPWQPVSTNDYSSLQYNLDLIDAYEAWNVETGEETITVAILDSGIDTDHDEFVGRISSLSYNAYTEEIGIAFVEDDLGHGTNVAGIIAAQRNNSLGIDGITDNVQLMIVKVNKPGEEGYLNSLITKGIYYAVNNGADIINLSLGSATADSGIQAAVEYAHEHEVFVVAASGNDGNDITYYPAGFQTTISVGSVDENAVISDFSSYGSTIDLVAPGDMVYTTNLENGYAQVSGTSFAAPHVAGVLALLLSMGEFSYEEIWENIFRSSVDLGNVGKDIYYGYGLLNAYNSVSTDLVKITFETFEGNELSPIWVIANQPYDVLEKPSKENYSFVSWFLDSSLNNILTEGYIFIDDTTLFAKYEPIYYSVTFLVDQDTYQEITIMSGEVISNLPDVVVEGFIFYGWYYSTLYEDKYVNQPIQNNTTLYAKIDELMYILTFLDSDGNFYDEILVYPNESVIAPEGPTRSSDELFDYEFIYWDQVLENITQDLIINPVYKKTLIFSAASLSPGIDTISQNQIWIDEGISLINDAISYTVSGVVDSSKVGQYIVIYSIYFEDEKVHKIIRVVNVIEKNEIVNITLNDAITTIIVGNGYLEAGAISNLGTVEIIGSVNTNETGVYKLIYRVSYNNKVVEKSRFVYVIDADFIPLDNIEWYVEKGDQDEQD
jgi:hypothetical protein